MGTRTANMPPKKSHGFSMYNLSTSAKYSTPFFPKIQEKNLSISHFSPDCTWKTHVIFSGHIAASRTHLMAAYTSLHSPWLLRITHPNTTKLLHVSSSCSFRGPDFASNSKSAIGSENGCNRTPEYSRRGGMPVRNISAFFFCDV